MAQRPNLGHVCSLSATNSPWGGQFRRCLMAQADMFLKLTNIKGEALDKKHPGEIEVLSWSFGASQTGSAHGGTGSGTGKVAIQDLTITHYVDTASTDLLKHLTNGKHIDEGILTVRKAGGTHLEYLK